MGPGIWLRPASSGAVPWSREAWTRLGIESILAVSLRKHLPSGELAVPHEELNESTEAAAHYVQQPPWKPLWSKEWDPWRRQFQEVALPPEQWFALPSTSGKI